MRVLSILCIIVYIFTIYEVSVHWTFKICSYSEAIGTMAVTMYCALSA